MSNKIYRDYQYVSVETKNKEEVSEELKELKVKIQKTKQTPVKKIISFFKKMFNK
jgi:hypothetical protein